jgi:hypothetical protein
MLVLPQNQHSREDDCTIQMLNTMPHHRVAHKFSDATAAAAVAAAVV